MKVLVKPNSLEEMYENVKTFLETCSKYSNCSSVTACNRYFSGEEVTNQSPIDDEDILF